MKRSLFFIVFTASLIACTTNDKKSEGSASADSTMQAEKAKMINDTANYTTIEWIDSTFISMGIVKEGAQVEVSYRFRNTGNNPLIIANVTASCGCTIPETPQQPFAPGEEGVIKAKFDSKNRLAMNRKHISVDANTKPSRSHELEFTVDVRKQD